MDAGRLGEVGPAHHGDAAVQVVDDDGGHPGEQDDARQEGEEYQHGGQNEDVEGDVDTELGILDAEGLRIEGQENLAPAGGQLPGRAEQSQHSGHRPSQAPSQGLDDRAVSLQVTGGLVVGHPDLPGPVGRRHRDEDGSEHDGEPHQEQDNESNPLRPQHAGVADLAVPEDLGPHLRHDADDDGDRGDDRDGQRQGPGTTPRGPAARCARRADPASTEAPQAEQPCPVTGGFLLPGRAGRRARGLVGGRVPGLVIGRGTHDPAPCLTYVVTLPRAWSSAAPSAGRAARAIVPHTIDASINLLRGEKARSRLPAGRSAKAVHTGPCHSIRQRRR